MDEAEPGHIVGKLNLRSHLAGVDSTYNTMTFSITCRRGYGYGLSL